MVVAVDRPDEAEVVHALRGSAAWLPGLCRPYSQNAMRGTPMSVVLFVVVSTAN
jgi:hypothetical protein